MKRKFILSSVIVLVLLIIYPLVMLGCKRTQHFKLSQFISPETCGGCHSKIYEQWKNSMHNLAHSDPIYNEIAQYLLKGLTDPGEVKESEICVKCHTPVGFVTGNPRKTSDELDSVPKIAKQGIQCDYCHSATGAGKIYNNDLKLDPGTGPGNFGTKRGPFKDSQSGYHESEYSEFHTQSKICGTCHNVKHVAFGTWLETTYEEWKNGPYNSKDSAKRVPCQGCHMYQRPDVPATGSTPRPKNPDHAANNGPKRDHIFTHYFVGANGYVPGTVNKDETKSAMALARLQNAAELSIDDSRIAKNKIYITIKNTGAGHYLPTGLTDVRQMWLEISIKNEKGKLLYSSGVTDKNGYLPKEVFLYNTVFGDGKGRPVYNVSKAREILRDRRIPPGESLKEKIVIPDGTWKSLKVEVKLLYRIAPQKIVDTILGAGKLTLPVVVMEEISRDIRKEDKGK